MTASHAREFLALKRARHARLRLHAIYVALGERSLFECSLCSIYPFADGITVITTLDRDWSGTSWNDEGLAELVLERRLDPDRKVSLLVPANETNEARARNRAMDFAAPRRSDRRLRRQHGRDFEPAAIDYFWIVDADEIYEPAAVEALTEYVARTRHPVYQVAAKSYFRRWNYQIDRIGYFPAFLRSDLRLGSLRNVPTSLLGKMLFRIPYVPFEIVIRACGVRTIPPSIGYFHHGSYVGPRERIEKKLYSTGHNTDIPPTWLEDVYDTWTPASRNFHPLYPETFPSVTVLPTEDLPGIIRDFDWPSGYVVD